MMQTDKEYAKALFSLVVEEGDVDKCLCDLRNIRSLVSENPQYIQLLSSPAIPLGERLNIIDQAFLGSVDEYVLYFLKLLCENGRINLILSCIEEFENMVMEFSKRTVARVSSAVPLSEEQKSSVLKKLEKISGKRVDIIFTEDTSLIGGIVIEIDGKTYDGSVKGSLRDLKEVINR